MVIKGVECEVIYCLGSIIRRNGETKRDIVHKIQAGSEMEDNARSTMWQMNSNNTENQIAI